jgi:hypothetical protein
MSTPYTATAILYSKGGASIANSPLADNPNAFSKNFSHPVVKQNHVSTGYVSGTDGAVQEFYLPSDYVRGDKVPDLTGFQVYLSVNDSSKPISYDIQRYEDTLAERLTANIKITAVTPAGSGGSATVTYTTQLPHYLKINDKIKIFGFVPNGYNGTYVITATPNSTQFTVTSTVTDTVTTYGAIAGSSILSKTLLYQNKTYFGVGQLNLRSVSVKNKINKHHSSHGEYTYKCTRTTKGIKKGTLISIVTGTKLDGVFKVKSVTTKHGKTSFVVWGSTWKSKTPLPKINAKTCKVLVWSSTDPTIKTIANIPEVPEDVDDRYDSPQGWTGLVKGTASVGSVTGDQWLDVKFKSVTIDSDWVNQKFKLTIYGDGIDKIYYTAPSPINNVQAFKKSTNQQIDASSSAILFKMLASTADSGTDFLSNAYRSITVKNEINNILDSGFNFWSSKPNPSKYGVESLYFDVSNNSGDAIIIDSIFVDSLTPGANFHVYYSTDKSGPGTDENSWDLLLWTPVSKTFTTNKKQSYVLPIPITAKYVKIEFSNLQASYYDPGSNHMPILYKKYPEWVLNYFMAVHDLIYNKTNDPIISSQISVEYDTIGLAYYYYKGDILQVADQPVTIETTNAQNNIVTDLLKNASVNLTDYDAISLRNINTSFDQFRLHPGYNAGNDTAVDKAATLQSINNFFNYSVEQISKTQAQTAIVSTTERNHLLLEKQMPVMYFYTTSRHGYREAKAKFDNNKAYFVKIKEVKFERNNHNVISDKDIYKFAAGDNANFEHCDFTYDSTTGKWVIQ